MRVKYLLLIAALFMILRGTGQTSGFLFSSIKRNVQIKHDSLLLIQNEQKMWNAANKGNVMMFDNPMIDCEFRVLMSKASIQSCFKDSIPLKSGASEYLMNLMENRNADTCYLMSFSPFLTFKYQSLGEWVFDPDTSTIKTGNRIITRHREPGPWQTGLGVLFLMPLSSYPTFLPEKEMKQANDIYRKQFASLIGGKLSRDTIFRVVQFTRDSNEYLPQAPYANLLSALKDLTLSGQISAYTTRDLSIKMSKAAIENTFVAWDSTNHVGDPNSPGTFIFAPLKREGQVKTLLLYEKWNFFEPPLIYFPKPYTGCSRKVSAYGLLLDSGKVLWFSFDEVNKAFAKSKYNLIPYEECFRAERFKTLQIQVHTW